MPPAHSSVVPLTIAAPFRRSRGSAQGRADIAARSPGSRKSHRPRRGGNFVPNHCAGPKRYERQSLPGGGGLKETSSPCDAGHRLRCPVSAFRTAPAATTVTAVIRRGDSRSWPFIAEGRFERQKPGMRTCRALTHTADSLRPLTLDFRPSTPIHQYRAGVDGGGPGVWGGSSESVRSRSLAGMAIGASPAHAKKLASN